MNIIKDRIARINSLLNELNSSLKMSVEKAIAIGRELSEQKAEMDHGQFLPWLENNFEMSQPTASRYMRLYDNQCKLVNVNNLQDAYKQIEQIEYQEKKAKEQEDGKIIFEYKRTGMKPQGWERRHDYLYKKMLDDVEYEKRKEEHFKKQREEKKEEIKTNVDERFKKIESLFDAIKNDKVDIENKKEELKLNAKDDDNFQTAIFLILDEYLNKINNKSRRIETAQNVIKYLRDKIIQYQRL